MGNTQPNEYDQLAVADISISSDGKVISERKINFCNNAIEIIVDNINQNS